MKRSGRFTTLAAVLVLVLAACGGGDDDAGGGNAPVDADSPAVGPSGGGGGDDGGGNDGVVTTFGNIPGLSAECTAVGNLSLAMTGALTGSFDGVPDDIIDALPAVARDDGRILVDALDEFAAGMQAAGIQLDQQTGLANLSQEQIEEWSALSERIFDDDVEDALERLSAAVSAACAPGG